MERNNLVSWTSIISGFATHRTWKELMVYFEREEKAGGRTKTKGIGETNLLHHDDSYFMRVTSERNGCH